jgi:hypothetical protein
VRRQQLKASVTFFYLLTGVFLIAFVEKLVPDIVLRVQKEKEFISGRYGSCFSGKAITAYFVANKKTILLLASLDFVGVANCLFQCREC